MTRCLERTCGLHNALVAGTDDDGRRFLNNNTKMSRTPERKKFFLKHNVACLLHDTDCSLHDDVEGKFKKSFLSNV